MSLKGKTAIVTGSSTGIGFAIAKALADDGAHVVLNGRDEHWLGAARKLIEGARAVVADLGTAEGSSRPSRSARSTTWSGSATST